MGTQVRDLRGYTKDKRNAEEKMIQLTLQMGGAVMAWAEVTGNQGMAEEMNLMQSTLHSYRDAVVAERCQVVHDVALANMASPSGLWADGGGHDGPAGGHHEVHRAAGACHVCW
ncbi:MAG: hypothetical protein IPN62_15360 [Flavobacteriales bacterium]|nr:hypothetical protein [Flavobacteriales bacterium]